MTDYESMSIDELEAENSRLMQSRKDIKAQQLALTATLDAKRKRLAVAEEIARIRERHGVDVQIVGPSAIETSEAVRGPGMA